MLTWMTNSMVWNNVGNAMAADLSALAFSWIELAYLLVLGAIFVAPIVVLSLPAPDARETKEGVLPLADELAGSTEPRTTVAAAERARKGQTSPKLPTIYRPNRRPLLHPALGSALQFVSGKKTSFG